MATLRIDVHLDETDSLPAMKVDIRRGMTSDLKEIPPKYFYDERGSALFEAITELPEYYQTRTEKQLLDQLAPRLAEEFHFEELVEIGSGSSAKTRVLLDALTRSGSLRRYIPMDVSETMLRETAEDLVAEYPRLDVHGVIGDFTRHLDEIPSGGRRLVVFLGGTIGNLKPAPATALLKGIRAGAMREEDQLLLGTDLVKDIEVLEAAYNDSAGITADFNRNVLRVVNERLGADFDPDRFEHVAFFDRENSWIEMRLRSHRDQTATIEALDLTIPLKAGEEIRTEISCKYTRESVERMLRDAGLRLTEWITDPAEMFALSLSTPL